MIINTVQSWWSRAVGGNPPRFLAPANRTTRCPNRARLSGSRIAAGDPRLPADFASESLESVTAVELNRDAKPFSILVPVDFSPSSLLALDCAIHMAVPPRARIILLHAIHLNLPVCGPASSAKLKTSLCQEAMAKADPILLSARARGVPAFCLMEEGAPAAVIARAARRCSPDVIILTQARHGPVCRFFGRGTVQKVVRSAPCPVLVLPRA